MSGRLFCFYSDPRYFAVNRPAVSAMVCGKNKQKEPPPMGEGSDFLQPAMPTDRHCLRDDHVPGVQGEASHCTNEVDNDVVVGDGT